MAETTYTITANGTSGPHTVPALKLLGVETSDAIRIYAKGGSEIFNTRDDKKAAGVWCPNDSITIKAEADGATVIITTDD